MGTGCWLAILRIDKEWGTSTWVHYKCWKFVDEALVETFSDANAGFSCAVGGKPSMMVINLGLIRQGTVALGNPLEIHSLRSSGTI